MEISHEFIYRYYRYFTFTRTRGWRRAKAPPLTHMIERIIECITYIVHLKNARVPHIPRKH